jgi:hypothetical protein
MAIIFTNIVDFALGETFHFGSFTYIANKSGVLHRIADEG